VTFYWNRLIIQTTALFRLKSKYIWKILLNTLNRSFRGSRTERS